MAFSQQERSYYDQLFLTIDKDDSGVLPGQDALPFLMTANLPQQTLGEVWAIADPDNNGFLTKEGWYRAARTIGWLQKGGKTVVEDGLANQPGPYPTFSGQPPPPAQALSAQPTGQLPPLTPADRAKFTKIFVGCGPSNGLVSGDKARDVFLKSKLNYDKLGQIWGLADTQSRGSLDLTDFIIGMYLIQSSMANPSLAIPASLPPGTYESASGGRALPASPIARQNTGPGSPIRPQYTGPQQPQRAGSVHTPTRSATYGSGFASQDWDVTPDAKAASDRFFSQLDPSGRGFIEGDVAVPFMLQSQLDEGALASIWDLADIRKEGRLNKDEFAVAMHLINGKLGGREVPNALPNSLIPPSLRSEYGGHQGAAQQPSSAAKDLFDLFADDPPPVVAQSTGQPAQSNYGASVFTPQPPSRRGTAPPPPAPRGMSPAATPRSPASFAPQAFAPSDLLGDDSVPDAEVPDHSAEIGNKRNQLENTTRGVASLEKDRADLDRAAQSSAAELADLETKLVAARAKHESETKAVAELRTRVSEQKERIQSVNMDFIAAQSDVSALQSERDELEQALLGDKEEIRGLQRRMKEVDEEKAGLKLLLEKLKKEARQQKGMVSIAKKQLATSEGGRDSVQGEIRTVEREAEAAQASPAPAAVPLPATPKALSPAPTGVSQRSNNPFDRFRSVTSPPPVESPEASSPGTAAVLGVGAAIGAAAGVVVAGAETLYDAAKEVVSPSEPKQDDPFAPGAKDEASDPFGAGVASQAENDVPAPPIGADANTFDNFDSGFGDSFDANAVAEPPAQSSTDFDAAFADFDEPAPHSASEGGLPSGIPKSAVPYLRPEPERTASTQAVDGDSLPPSPPSVPSGGAPVPESALRNEVDDSSDEDEGPEDLDVPAGRFASQVDNTPVLYPPVESSPQVAASERFPPAAEVAAVVASEPELEPEPVAEAIPEPAPAPIEPPKTRRSAPPPPAKASVADDLDPFGASSSPVDADPFAMPASQDAGFGGSFGADNFAPAAAGGGEGFGAEDFAPAATLPPGAAPAAPAVAGGRQPSFATGFDDDDFDFSDLPPARVAESGIAPTQPTAPAQASGKDDFDFDDEFDQPSTSDGSNGISKSYELVSPPSGGALGIAPGGAGAQEVSLGGVPGPQDTTQPAEPSFDAWGFGAPSPALGGGAQVAQLPPQDGQGGQGAAAFSFDDAFGGDFEPAPAPAADGRAPAAGASSALSPPALPERRDSGVGAQPDDIEDVKKLCAMGFPRSLVVEALAANSYDFQKTLNVLLQ